MSQNISKMSQICLVENVPQNVSLKLSQKYFKMSQTMSRCICPKIVSKNMSLEMSKKCPTKCVVENVPKIFQKCLKECLVAFVPKMSQKNVSLKKCPKIFQKCLKYVSLKMSQKYLKMSQTMSRSVLAIRLTTSKCPYLQGIFLLHSNTAKCESCRRVFQCILLI